uniref:Uncharacterized protein n=1 Tax=viral metagenome TaxID=1070528 RepID=A0A6C0B988_9ZZZZ
MQKTRRKHYKKNNKSKRQIGGENYSADESPIMLGIPVNDVTLEEITGRDEDDGPINRHLKGMGTQIRVQRIDGSGLRILGYNIENVSHINGPLKLSSDLLRELRTKRKSFKKDIKDLNSGLRTITLSLYEAESDEEVVEIDKIEPYLFQISSV